MRNEVLISFALLLFPSILLGQKVNYEIRFNGRVIGKDVIAIKKGKQGYEVSTQYGYAIGPSEGVHIFNQPNSYIYSTTSTSSP